MPYYKTMYEAQAAMPGIGIIAGTVEFAGLANDPDGFEGTGISSATHVSTGQYSIVLDGTGALDILAVTYGFEDSTGDAGLNVSIESITEATRTIVIQIMDSATPSAANAADGDKLHLAVFFRKSNVTR